MGDAINLGTMRHLSGRPAVRGPEQAAWDRNNPDYAQRWGMFPSRPAPPVNPGPPLPPPPQVPPTVPYRPSPTGGYGQTPRMADETGFTYPGPQPRPMAGAQPMRPGVSRRRQRFTPGMAQPRQSPYSTGTPYGQQPR